MKAVSGCIDRANLWGQMHAQGFDADIKHLAAVTVRTLRAGGRLLFAGNGGSAADAQHLAAEYVGVGLPALSLTADSSVLTALANDFGYAEVFARQLRAIGQPGDLLFLHSTSGNSHNVIDAALVADEMRMGCIALLARGGGSFGDLLSMSAWHFEAPVACVIPTDDTALAQEAHLAIGHIVFYHVRWELGR